jgi:predicted dithiol-disulfide oxidoreductase (DUF899 family)
LTAVAQCHQRLIIRRGLRSVPDASAQVFHTYSTYSRGLDPLNTAYQLLDLAPRGRDEDDLAWPMQWLRRHDAYDN